MHVDCKVTDLILNLVDEQVQKICLFLMCFSYKTDCETEYFNSKYKSRPELHKPCILTGKLSYKF